MNELDKIRFPIGKFKKPEFFNAELIQQWISEIESFPSRLTNEVIHLNDEQLDTPYREDGWTIRQVVHHCADSHSNSLIRFKLALTENKPTIKPYYEDRWAELADSREMPLQPSLKMLEGIHSRWIYLLNSLSDDDLNRSFIHPEHGKEFQLKEIIALYAWHCNHHLTHIINLKLTKGWN